MESNSPIIPKTSKSTMAFNEFTADRTLDITGEVCPMTFVRTRLALDCMARGETLLVLLCGDEPRRNVPATARAQGHAVLAEATDAAGLTRVVLRRA